MALNRRRHIITMQVPPNSEIHDEIVRGLLQSDHAWWFDYIDIKQTKHRGALAILRGKPQFSPNFWSMYQYGPEHNRDLPRSLSDFVDPIDFQRVLGAIRRVTEINSEPYSHTIRVVTGRGEHRMVEAYLRRMTLASGEHVLASLHSNLTVSNDEQLFNRTVLDQLQAFVFAKRWDSLKECFVFTYVNQRLADAFGLSSPEDVKGKSDRDFIANENEIEAFKRGDSAAFYAQSENFLLIREESVTPLKNDGRTPTQTLRLLTFKRRYAPLMDSDAVITDRLILGIAFDVTVVTDLMREAAESSEHAIYAKDSESRYIFGNQMFSKLIGAGGPEDYYHKTYEEVVFRLAANGKAEYRGAIEGLRLLMPNVIKDDANVLKGATITRVREANFFDGGQWISKKRRVFVGKERLPYILGTFTPLFGGSLASMLDKMPQCISVKKYYPKAKGKNRSFRIVWGNRSFLARHRRKSVKEIQGFSDFDLWPEGQAGKFMKHDLQCVEIGERLDASEAYIKLSESAQWEVMQSELKKARLWEFRETQIVRGKNGKGAATIEGGKYAALQTTKWPMKLCGDWFVIVVYSDVTKGDKEQEKYHDMTVHTIRGAISPLNVAEEHIQRAQKAQPKNRAFPIVAQCMRAASESVNWFLTHHLELLKMEVSVSPTGFANMKKLLTDICGQAKVSGLTCAPIRLQFSTPRSSDEMYAVSETFMNAVITELIRNSQKAIMRVETLIDNIKTGPLTWTAAQSEMGWNRISKRYRPYVAIAMKAEAGLLKISIVDNGDCCFNRGARSSMKRKFTYAKKNPYSRENLRLGLAFCVLAVEKQGGFTRLHADEEKTQLDIFLKRISVQES